MKRMLFNATYQEELRVATVEGQKLINFDIETSSKTQRRGNIYKGVITRVEPSLEACFVDYGTEKQGFLPFKEIDNRYLPENNRSRDLSKLTVGLELIIQIEKDERGNKGAALTTYVSLPGRYLVLMPNNSRSGGISRRIDGEERDELKASLSQVEVPQGMSIIARTAALGRVQEELQWDLNYLCNLWDAIKTAAQNNAGSFLIYQESSLVIRSIRDHFSPDISEVLIDVEDIFEQAKQFMSHVMPSYVERIKLYHDDVPLFSRFQIEHQIESAFGRLVNLPSGGSIAIDHTEALTAIDVNSAKANKGIDIEATALATNLEAADEIARQLRLRDLGGLVVVDFIDMENQRNQREVETHFKQQLALDRARIQMGKLSKFGLLELSRQRLSASLEESTTISCPRCSGIGIIRGTESSAIHILRIIQEEAVKGYNYLSALHVQLPVSVATYLLNEKRDDLAKIENRMKTKIILVPNVHLESPNYKIRKISNSNIDSVAGKVSYNLVEAPDESQFGYQLNDKKNNNEKAVVKNLTPAQPAPVVSEKSYIGSLFNKIVKLVTASFSGKENKTDTKPLYNQARDNRYHNNKNNKSKPKAAGLNRSNTRLQNTRSNANRNPRDESSIDKSSYSPRNNPGKSQFNDSKLTNKTLEQRNSEKSVMTNVAESSNSNHNRLPKQSQNPHTRPGKSDVIINQEWQSQSPDNHEAKAKSERVENVSITKIDNPVVIIKEIKETINTITEPIDLGSLQMIGTDHDLAKSITVEAISQDTNAKRFNDIVVNHHEKTSVPKDYQIVETKV